MKQSEAEREARTLEDGWVIMNHPDLEDSFTKTTAEAFEEVWEEKGWVNARLINPETKETYSEEQRVALANAEALARAQEKPEEADAAGDAATVAEQAEPATPSKQKEK